jgi:hypothetical protein
VTTDVPVPFQGCWLHWIAVPTNDQAGVMAALGLTRPVPIGFAAADQLVDEDSHESGAAGYERVVVTPALDGWTFVLGRWCSLYAADRRDDVLRLCEALSAQYGGAQAYYYGMQGDGSAWLLAEDGVVRRRFVATGEPGDELLTIGEPLAFEVHRLAQEDPEEWSSVRSELGLEVAAEFGVCPVYLDPSTTVDGQCFVATTPYGAL